VLVMLVIPAEQENNAIAPCPIIINGKTFKLDMLVGHAAVRVTQV
jgi:hypothetical protein